MKIINIDEWKRKKYYLFYKDYTWPFFSLTVQFDITKLVPFLKKEKISFFPTFLYLVMASMNEIDEFKYRVRGDQVVLHDTVTPSYTVLNKEEQYVFCTTEFDWDYKAFYQNVKQDIAESLNSDRLEDIPGRDDLVFVSSLPWSDYTQMTHPIDTNNPDSFTRLTFGKYYHQEDKIKIPLTIFVHHGLCDGLHATKLLNKLTDKIELFINHKI